MKVSRLTILGLFIFLACTVAQGAAVHNDSEFDAVVVQANRLFLDASFDEGIALLKEYEKKKPGTPAASFFIANGYWWKIFRAYVYDKSQKTTEFDDDFEYFLNQTISRAESLLKRNKKDAQALFYLGNAYSLKSRVKGLRGSYFSASREAAKGKRYLEDVLDIDPSQTDANYNLGVYNYFAGTLPGYAKVLKTFLFLPGGSKEKGLSMLKLASKKSIYFGDEAQLLLARFYADFEEQPLEALRIVVKYREAHPGNAWFHYWLGTLYSDEINDYNMAGKIYMEILDKCRQGVLHYTDEVKNQAWLKMARVYSRQYDPERAIREIKNLLGTKPTQPAWIVAKAYLELGNIYDQIGMRKEAIGAYRRVLTFKNHRNYHEEAEKLLRRDYDQKLADIYRLNLEGRRFLATERLEEAEASFQKVLQQYPNNDQTLYAIAELYFAKGMYKESADLLNRILSKRPKEPKWLVPGIYVRLGQVYEARKQEDAARKLYEKALDTDFIASDDRNFAKRALRLMNSNS